ncbi:MAG: hypothetical protein LBR83_04895 [Clostridiales bacterium]|jgi:predicted O-linked N-acetylglucosamine transferase (SPINDLY family)|nr:hypothetical protein [Clostridiales bacterium]
MAIISEREFAVKDEPMALVYLQCGRHALLRNEFEIAMENFERCYNARITRKLSVLLLNQMANCMGQLEYYDRQQGYLEDLCELDLSFENVRQLMNIYLATNNEVKRSAFAEKIRRLTAKDKSEERSAIFLLSQAKDHNEVLQRSLEWLKENPQDVDVARAVINVYMEMERIEDAFVFIRQLDAEFFKDKLLLELSALHRKMFDAEGGHDFLMRHMELYKENVMGVNRLAFTLITNTCYDGLLTGDDYVHWMWRAWESTKPQVALNVNFDNDTNYFRKIRVGIISYDFRMHSVGKFIMSLFDTVPTDTQIETYCYYTHPEHTDDYTEVIKSQADVFKHVGKYSDKQLRKELLSDRLDILVDLNGQTAGSRLGLVAERFAPVQATWMGFPFSSFHYNVDYNIGDYFFDPVDGETERYCTEKILRMDPSYMCFALGMDYYINPEPPQVKNQYVTFGMMNNPQK